jgi:hypothetical protein
MLIDRRTVIIGAAALAAVRTAESAKGDTAEVQINTWILKNLPTADSPDCTTRKAIRSSFGNRQARHNHLICSPHTWRPREIAPDIRG